MSVYQVEVTIIGLIEVEGDAFITPDELEALAEQAYIGGDWIPDDHYFNIEEVLG